MVWKLQLHMISIMWSCINWVTCIGCKFDVQVEPPELFPLPIIVLWYHLTFDLYQNSSRRIRKVRESPSTDIRYLLRHEWARTSTKRKRDTNDLMIELFCLNFQQTRTFSVYMKAKRGNFQKVIKMSGVLFANSKPIHRPFISIVSIESDLEKYDIH